MTLTATTWHNIEVANSIVPVAGKMLRIVESQEQVATTHVVDSLAEQALLEELLEKAKPPMRPGSEDLHYLLLTPFRYPPLMHGSRFGQRHEPSIFYGSLTAATALVEASYYRLVFWFGMQKPPLRPIRSRHTLFSVTYQTRSGVELHQAPFDEHRTILTCPTDYSETQELGRCMRESRVLAFEFHSARDPEGGINVGLFEPSALSVSQPCHQEEWLCDVDGDTVCFLHLSARQAHSFPVETFLISGRFPAPAA